ncbi:MAG: hypothetical protein WCL00_02190 [Bacteroidota bacterium]
MNGKKVEVLGARIIIRIEAEELKKTNKLPENMSELDAFKDEIKEKFSGEVSVDLNYRVIEF